MSSMDVELQYMFSCLKPVWSLTDGPFWSRRITTNMETFQFIRHQILQSNVDPLTFYHSRLYNTPLWAFIYTIPECRALVHDLQGTIYVFHILFSQQSSRAWITQGQEAKDKNLFSKLHAIGSAAIMADICNFFLLLCSLMIWSWVKKDFGSMEEKTYLVLLKWNEQLVKSGLPGQITIVLHKEIP